MSGKSPSIEGEGGETGKSPRSRFRIRRVKSLTQKETLKKKKQDRKESHSMSPKKNRPHVLTPVFTPVIRGLRRLKSASKSHSPRKGQHLTPSTAASVTASSSRLPMGLPLSPSKRANFGKDFPDILTSGSVEELPILDIMASESNVSSSVLKAPSMRKLVKTNEPEKQNQSEKRKQSEKKSEKRKQKDETDQRDREIPLQPLHPPNAKPNTPTAPTKPSSASSNSEEPSTSSQPKRPQRPASFSARGRRSTNTRTPEDQKATGEQLQRRSHSQPRRRRPSEAKKPRSRSQERNPDEHSETPRNKPTRRGTKSKSPGEKKASPTSESGGETGEPSGKARRSRRPQQSPPSQHSEEPATPSHPTKKPTSAKSLTTPRRRKSQQPQQSKQQPKQQEQPQQQKQQPKQQEQPQQPKQQEQPQQRRQQPKQEQPQQPKQQEQPQQQDDQDDIELEGKKPDSRRSESSGEHPPKPDSNKSLTRRNLDRKSLQNMKDLKNSIFQMRTQRRKVKFGERGSAPQLGGSVPSSPSMAGTPTPSPTNLTKSASLNLEALGQRVLPLAGTANSSVATPVSNAVQSSSSTYQSSGQIQSSVTSESPKVDPNSSKSTFQSSGVDSFGQSIGAINLGDLDVGFLNKGASPSDPTEEDMHAADLEKQIKKAKKLIKRSSREVWSERDEIIAMQRKNWSLRKGLMQSDAPRDSVTTLNMKIEKLLRQSRELDTELDRMQEEKESIENECVTLTTAISDFRGLLDNLNQQIVPLLPPIPPAGPEGDKTPHSASANRGVVTASQVLPVSPLLSPPGTSARTASGQQYASTKLRQATPSDPAGGDTLADTMHSTEGEDEEGSLSLGHLRMAMSHA